MNDRGGDKSAKMQSQENQMKNKRWKLPAAWRMKRLKFLVINKMLEA